MQTEQPSIGIRRESSLRKVHFLFFSFFCVSVPPLPSPPQHGILWLCHAPAAANRRARKTGVPAKCGGVCDLPREHRVSRRAGVHARVLPRMCSFVGVLGRRFVPRVSPPDRENRIPRAGRDNARHCLCPQAGPSGPDRHAGTFLCHVSHVATGDRNRNASTPNRFLCVSATPLRAHSGTARATWAGQSIQSPCTSTVGPVHKERFCPLFFIVFYLHAPLLPTWTPNTQTRAQFARSPSAALASWQDVRTNSVTTVFICGPMRVILRAPCVATPLRQLMTPN